MSHLLSRVGGQGGLGGFLTRKSMTLEGDAKALRASAGEGEATEVSEARSQRAPWEEKAHARVHAPKTVRGGEALAERVHLRSAEAFTSVVKHSVPR